MALNPFFSDTFAKAAVDAGCALANAGKLRVYTGAQPTDANTAIGAQSLLGEFTMNATAFAASVASGTAPTRNAVATANVIADITASATGTAAWFRLLKSDGTTVLFDGTVGTSGCDLNLTDITITTGETMSVTSFTVTNPE
jgi:hypothetical protein